MNRLIRGMIVSGVLPLAVGLSVALAQQSTPGTPLVPGRKTTSRENGMSRWDFVDTTRGALFVGVGDDTLSTAQTTPGVGPRQHVPRQADLGGSLRLSDDVNLQAAGRFRSGSVSDPGGDDLGGHVGLKISF